MIDFDKVVSYLNNIVNTKNDASEENKNKGKGYGITLARQKLSNWAKLKPKEEFAFGGASYEFDATNNIDIKPSFIRNTPIFSYESFTDAYKRAKEQGLKEFMFNGRNIAIKHSDNPKYTKKEYSVSIPLNKREVLDENKKVISDSTRLEPYIGQIPGEREYNGVKKYQEGGSITGKQKRVINKIYRKNKDVPFINRILSKSTLYIPDWENEENYATHKLGWAENENGAFIFPNVQQIGDNLKDFTLIPDKWAGLDSAINKDNVINTTPEIADLFTKHYKESKYFKKYIKNMFKNK